MTNPHKGEVELVAGGETYTLRMSINEIVGLQRLTGMKVTAISAALSDPDVDVDLWRSALWASLQRHHKGTALDDAGDLIAEAGLPAVMAAVGEALQAAFPQADPDAPANPPKAGRSGTGKR